MNDLISIIIPVYCVEKYLEKCIKSITGQTYKNIEIILIDDGSTDNCGKICDKYACEDSRIVVIHKENGGLSCARNHGLKYAHGKYIMFVDSDDEVEINIVECLYKLILEHNAQISIVSKKDVFEDERLRKAIGNNKVVHDGRIVEGSAKEILELIFVEGVHCWEVWGKLFDASLFNNHKFMDNIVYEDVHILPRIIFDAKKIVYADIPLYLYLIRADGIMGHGKKYVVKKDLVRIADLNVEYFRKKGNDEIFCIICYGYCMLLYFSLCRVMLDNNVEENKEFIDSYIIFYNKIRKDFLHNKLITKKPQIWLSYMHFNLFLFIRKALFFIGYYNKYIVNR